MYFNASSWVYPQVEAPISSQSGKKTRHPSPSGSSATWNVYGFIAAPFRRPPSAPYGSTRMLSPTLIAPPLMTVQSIPRR